MRTTHPFGRLPPGEEQRSDSVSVLYVTGDSDDDAATRLDDGAFAVETVGRPDAAFEVVSEGDVDCVLAAHELPGTDGLELFEELRDRGYEGPFVLYPRAGSERLASRAISAGVSEYVPRDGSGEHAAIAERITDVVEEHRTRRAREYGDRHYQELIESSPVPVVCYDETGAVVYANAACTELPGVDDANDLVGTDEMEFVDLADRRRVLEYVDRAAAGESSPPIEVTYVDEAGDPQGSLVVCTGIHEDIGPADAGPEVGRLRTLIDNLPGVVYRCTDDPDWPMTVVEGECESLTGHPAERFLAGDVSWGADVIHPADEDWIREEVQAAIEAGDPFELTYRIRTADGERKWVWERGRAVETADGDRAIEGFITDVTERREYERRLERLQEWIEIALSDNGVGIWVYDVETGTTTEYAVRQVFGVEKSEDDLTDVFFEYAHPEDAERIRGVHRNAIATGEDFREEFRVETDDGETRWLVDRGNALTDDGAVTHLVGVVADVTERKRREQRLERQNKRFDAFASVLAHDLKNPLSVVQGGIEHVQFTGDLDHLEGTYTAAKRLEALIDNLATAMRQGEIVGETSPVALEAVARRAWESADTREATLDVPEGATVVADEEALCRLLENLFYNAVEHGGSDVTVRVDAFPDGFAVEDDGPGIPPEDRETVFEPRYTTDEEGNGLGLTSVRQIASGHGWTAEATEGPSGGARFEFRGVERVE